MSKPLVEFAKRTAGDLATAHGFKRTGSRFIRLDRLMRSVWFIGSRASTAETCSFELVVDMGIPGISTFSGRAHEWVVRAYAEHVYRSSLSTGEYPHEVAEIRVEGEEKYTSVRIFSKSTVPIVRFEFGRDEQGGQVEEVVASALALLHERFLFRFDSEHEFYAWVRDNALTFADLKPGLRKGARDDFTTMELYPFNAVPRLELAGVYAAFLGRSDEAQLLQDLAVETAAKEGIDYAIPSIRDSIRHAAELGAAR